MRAHLLTVIPTMRFVLPAALLLSTTLLTACSGEVEDTRPGQPVKTRQQAFKAMIRSFEPMGVMLRNQTYDADKFLALADELSALRDAPWEHFGPDTDYPPSKTTAEAWRQPEKFARDKEAFITATDALLAAAQDKDRERLDMPYQAVYDACRDCHKTFRKR
ncbi:MAG: cytochrome c [Betaproteobacteria bacterium]|nr:cytochrome c [Betaproteobacteria bacterium]MCL2887126.1 cytochrome c [Betaproteobacteria bacterium]